VDGKNLILKVVIFSSLRHTHHVFQKIKLKTMGEIKGTCNILSCVP